MRRVVSVTLSKVASMWFPEFVFWLTQLRGNVTALCAFAMPPRLTLQNPGVGFPGFVTFVGMFSLNKDVVYKY